MNNLNTQAFMQQIRMLERNGIYVNKEMMRDYNVREKFYDVARNILGSDINKLTSTPKVRWYIENVFGRKDYEYFIGADAELKLDLEHATLLYYKLMSERSNLSTIALGLAYLLAAYQLEDEFAEILKTVIKGYISPKFVVTPQGFQWKRCNYILRKYMLNFTKPEGHKAYVFEPKNITQIAFLMSQGHNFQDAVSIMQRQETGIFYSFLPKHAEEKLAEKILSGEFDSMNGLYAPALNREVLKIEQSFGNYDKNYNVYNQSVKPYMINAMGLFIKDVMTELSMTNSNLLPSDFVFYHVTPKRVGVLVKDSLDINRLIPVNASAFKPIMGLSLRDIALGDV